MLIYKSVELLLQTIPEDDNNFHIKRDELIRWYDVYGERMNFQRSPDSIDEVVSNTIKEERFWNDDGKLKSYDLTKFLLDKRDDIKLNSWVSYQLACMLCSEEDIRTTFKKVYIYSLEEFLSRFRGPAYSMRLMDFWSHYINFVGVADPNPYVGKSFQELLSLYDKNFNVENIIDVWKCGFECAKQEGCNEAIGFFWNKLENIYDDKEMENQLINIGVHTYLKRYYKSAIDTSYHENRKINIIKFCLNHLKPESYRALMLEDLKVRGELYIVRSLIENHMYSQAKELIKVLRPDDVSHEEYLNLFYSLTRMNNFIPQWLSHTHADFLVWLWRREGFDKHRDYILDEQLSLFSILERVAIFNFPMSPLSAILDSANWDKIKNKVRSRGSNFCRNLYIINQRDVLQNRILVHFENGEKFINETDKVVLNELKESLRDKGVDVNLVFKLFIQGKREEITHYIQPVIKKDCETFLYDIDCNISHSFSSMLDGDFIFPETHNISPQLGNINILESSFINR